MRLAVDVGVRQGGKGHAVPKRIHPDWIVLHSLENPEGNRCVDLFRRPDASHGFEEFRRDPEDGGTWTAVAFHSGAAYPSAAAARAAAGRAVAWLDATHGG